MRNTLFIAFIFIVAPITIFADQVAVWSRDPITVVLPVGKEKMVSFPNSVMVGADENFLKIATITNVNGTLYFKAKQAFAMHRIQVKDTVTNNLILLNISASNSGNTTPLTIQYPDHAMQQLTEPSSRASDFLVLTRYAAQMLFAPTRLLPNDPTITQSAMQAEKTEPLLIDASAIAEPLQAWQRNGVIVTAVELRNQLNTRLVVTPELLCGQWQAITYLPSNQLASAGQAGDSAILFLISTQPFGQIMQQSC